MGLNIGHEPDDLTVNVVRDEPWSTGLRLKNATWPAAPTLFFINQGLTITSTLSEDDALAIWTMTQAQTASLTDGVVRLRVEGVTWWKGVSKCQD